MNSIVILKEYKDSMNRTISYTVRYNNGVVRTISAKKLKTSLSMGNTKIIEEDEKVKARKLKLKAREEELYNSYNKLKLLGRTKVECTPITYELIKTSCGHQCLLAINGENCDIYIPNDVIRLNDNAKLAPFTINITRFKGTLRVFGGRNLENTTDMFAATNAVKLDVEGMDTHKVKTMHNMFAACSAREINLTDFNTSKCERLERMFYNSRAKEINVKSFSVLKSYGSYKYMAICADVQPTGLNIIQKD